MLTKELLRGRYLAFLPAEEQKRSFSWQGVSSFEGIEETFSQRRSTWLFCRCGCFCSFSKESAAVQISLSLSLSLKLESRNIFLIQRVTSSDFSGVRYGISAVFFEGGGSYAVGDSFCCARRNRLNTACLSNQIQLLSHVQTERIFSSENPIEKSTQSIGSQGVKARCQKEIVNTVTNKKKSENRLWTRKRRL